MSTLRVEQETLEQLNFLKKQFGSKSYDELMRKMIEQVKIKVSMFGVDKGKIKSWTEQDREHDDEDRY